MLRAGLRLAVTLLTAVPLPGRGAEPAVPSRQAAAAAMYWAPAVGLAIGAVSAGVLLLARLGHAGPLLAAALAVTVGAVLTRALHLDGLADFADGLGSGRPADQALEIMKRSDIGPFGVVTLVLTLLIQVAALARADALGRGPAAVLTAAVTARLAMTLACRSGVPAARPAGLGSLVAGTVRPGPAAALTAVVLAAAAAGGLAPGTAGRWVFVAAAGAGLAVSAGVTALAVRRLGGITGDVLGAVAEITATVCLVVTALS
ncbi:MAG TPA: adenosylcobinamide-GDP ribazoletransferase [Streptosporangiaceae bacterium]|nr:adenosylcobinamide-GDP ribazoletransferase [Streptosporangiaceae bacterium]